MGPRSAQHEKECTDLGGEEVTTFDGETFDEAIDGKRLGVQLTAVRQHMLHASHWLSLKQIALATGFPEASISARLRDLRKNKFGALDVEKRRRQPEGGTWEYFVSQPFTLTGGQPDA